LLHVSTADGSLFAHVLDGNGTSNDSNSDIAALAEEVLDSADIGTEAIMVGDRLGRLIVAAVSGATSATGIRALEDIEVGGNSRDHSDESEESEDDRLDRHLEVLLMGC
jgi:hypothetical protein